eukprot:8297107-Prorocentrum_lima.AAC.1
MTSSLVGSEMCIRDSCDTDRHCCLVLDVACTSDSANATESLMFVDACSVSYTHLTLPTICSV